LAEDALDDDDDLTIKKTSATSTPAPINASFATKTDNSKEEPNESVAGFAVV
jgi:hypothetical protein